MHIIHGQVKKEDGTLVRESILFCESEEEARDREDHLRDFLEQDMDDEAVVIVYSPDEVKDFLESVTPELRFESEAVSADDEDEDEDEE